MSGSDFRAIVFKPNVGTQHFISCMQSRKPMLLPAATISEHFFPNKKFLTFQNFFTYVL